MPASVTVTVWPPIVRTPLRPIELALALTFQFTAFPTSATEAHATFELAVGALQPTGADAVIVPEPPAPVISRTFVVKLYGQMPV